MHTPHRFAACCLIIAAHLAGCGSDAKGGPDDGPAAHAGAGAESGSGGGKDGGVSGASGSSGGAATEPVKGETDFVSADPNNRGGGGRGGLTGAFDDAESGGSADAGSSAPGFGNAADGSNRTVERGDIYRVLDDQRILNLNGYRGLQVIDIRDLSAPRVEGRLSITGTPVEMYVAGDRALVLLNNWSGYYGTRDDIAVEQRQGGLVASVDISDRAHPKLLAQAVVPGSISTSRLTQGDGKAALYVASNGYYDSNGQNHTYVKSFDVSGDSLAEKSELDLGGYVADIQATVDVLLVANQEWNTDKPHSTVTVIDISRPDGTMVKGGTITTAGTVENKFNMDAYDGVLRIVSGVTWSGTRENHLETFDLADLKTLAPLDHCTFGGTEMLKATLFMEERAFFVTFFQTDPFHSFSIDAQGKCEEHNEFVVSGWNDFLRPALNDTRIVGIGTNIDPNTGANTGSTRAVSVSLYDATDVDNPNPLLARADVDATDYSYSEAQWDDRAFGVIEGAVQVAAKDGTTETGLILLPYQGWDNTSQRSVAQVQLLTFSDHTLTLRGVMDHGSGVRRSFPTDATTTANLSEEQLSLFDTANPDEPNELGRVDVAPNYSRVFVFGEHVARVKDRSMYFSWQSSSVSVEPPKTRVDIMARADDLETTAPKASFEVPAAADLIQVGDLLVSVAMVYRNASTNPDGTQIYDSTIDVYDLSDPAHPDLRGSLQTDRLQPSYRYYGYATDLVGDCFDCGLGYGGYWGYRYGEQTDHYIVGDAVAFTHYVQQQKSLGQIQYCNWNAPYSNEGCAMSSDGTTTCKGEYTAGGINCSKPQGGKEYCTGSFVRCSYETSECTEIAKPQDAMRSCNDTENIRYWQSLELDTLDLRNPDAPSLAPSLDFARDEEAQSLYSNGAQLYFNFQQPFDGDNDPRPQVKRYTRQIDLADPQHAVIGAAINVPGDVIASDGATVYTRDIVWDGDDTRTLVARLTIDKDKAYLQASHLFQDKAVQAVRLDGAGHMLVSSDPVYNYGYYYQPPQDADQNPQHTLEILDANSLGVVGKVDVDTWATFMDAKAGRALYRVGGSGLLVFDVEDAAHPKAQAFFATLGWPQELFFDGDEILFAAGPYGVYRFDADVYNLLTP